MNKEISLNTKMAGGKAPVLSSERREFIVWYMESVHTTKEIGLAYLPSTSVQLPALGNRRVPCASLLKVNFAAYMEMSMKVNISFFL